MMKKTMAFVLAVCLCLCCTACGLLEKASAFSTVHDAIEKTQALTSMDCEMDMEMNMSMEGMTMSVPVKASIKAKDTNTDKPTAYSVISTQMLGMDMEIEMYQEGDWAYVSMEDMQYKINVDAAEVDEYDYADDVDAMLQDLPENLFEGVEAVKNEDGSTTVNVPIPDEVFATVYKDFLDAVNTEADEDAKITIKDAVVKITVADGYVSVYDMAFNMTAEVMGVSTTTEVKAAITYKDPGAEVTVTPMEGYQDFEEFSEDALLGDDLLDEDLDDMLDEDLLDESLDGILDLG